MSILAQLAEYFSRLQPGQLARSAAYAMVIYGGFLALVWFLERRAGVDRARYHTRNFVNDVAYTIFYKAGFYNMLLLAALTNILEPHLAPLQLHLLRDLSWPVGLAVFWIGGDFVMYWWHRLQHANRFLWALHTIHHSQQHMTLFTASRRHPLENLMLDVLLFFGIFHVVLGVPTRGWMPLGAFITSFAAIQHAQLDWRFGPLYRLFASPRFHAFHHSTDPAHSNANFAFLFSAWDYLFRTAVPEQHRPSRYGVDSVDIRETLGGQLITPFRLMWAWRRRIPTTPVPADDSSLPAVSP